ncbi:RDD family protein [Vibrio sp. FNV 38]|nr:RDD family protein [Vibrio sp. FNV 38]
MNDNAPARMSDIYEYSGFWARVGSSIIDTILIGIITYPILISVYGWSYLDSDTVIHGGTDFLLSWVFPLVGTMIFWTYKQATPGKMAIAARIVDADTGAKPTQRQYIIRYLSYFISLLPLCLGFFWISWDKRKQGWHDKLANTVVISTKVKVDEVRFAGKN